MSIQKGSPKAPSVCFSKMDHERVCFCAAKIQATTTDHWHPLHNVNYVVNDEEPNL